MKVDLVKPVNHIDLYPSEDTQYVIDFSGEVNNAIVNVFLEKPGVSTEIIGLYALNAGQKINLTTIATHIARNTACYQHIRGVLDNNSESQYIGKILINKTAQQTKSFLDDKVLVIGENTKNRSDPILEIEANDVSASHGSTTGRIDENQLYYLRSRGLDYNEARGLMVSGFFEDLISQIKSVEIQSYIRNYLGL